MTMNLPTFSFSFNGATLTVEQETGWSLPDCQLVCNKLIRAGAYDPNSERQRNRAIRFAEAIVQTVKVEGDGLGFEWPSPDSSGECLAEAFAMFGKQKGLMSDFFTALRAVEELTPGDPALKKTAPPDEAPAPLSVSP